MCKGIRIFYILYELSVIITMGNILYASSVKCVDVHHYACVKAVIVYLCSDPNNVFVQIFQSMKSN